MNNNAIKAPAGEAPENGSYVSDLPMNAHAVSANGLRQANHIAAPEDSDQIQALASNVKVNGAADFSNLAGPEAFANAAIASELASSEDENEGESGTKWTFVRNSSESSGLADQNGQMLLSHNDSASENDALGAVNLVDLGPLPNPRVILQRLSRVRQYKNQVLDMIDRLKGHGSEANNEMLAKMVAAYDGFKEQETDYVVILERILAIHSVAEQHNEMLTNGGSANGQDGDDNDELEMLSFIRNLPQAGAGSSRHAAARANDAAEDYAENSHAYSQSFPPPSFAHQGEVPPRNGPATARPSGAIAKKRPAPQPPGAHQIRGQIGAAASIISANEAGVDRELEMLRQEQKVLSEAANAQRQQMMALKKQRDMLQQMLKQQVELKTLQGRQFELQDEVLERSGLRPEEASDQSDESERAFADAVGPPEFPNFDENKVAESIANRIALIAKERELNALKEQLDSLHRIRSEAEEQLSAHDSSNSSRFLPAHPANPDQNDVFDDVTTTGELSRRQALEGKLFELQRKKQQMDRLLSELTDVQQQQESLSFNDTSQPANSFLMHTTAETENRVASSRGVPVGSNQSSSSNFAPANRSAGTESVSALTSELSAARKKLAKLQNVVSRIEEASANQCAGAATISAVSVPLDLTAELQQLIADDEDHRSADENGDGQANQTANVRASIAQQPRNAQQQRPHQSQVGSSSSVEEVAASSSNDDDVTQDLVEVNAKMRNVYQTKLAEQQHAVDNLREERNRLLAIQGQLAKLHHSYSVVNENPEDAEDTRDFLRTLPATARDGTSNAAGRTRQLNSSVLSQSTGTPSRMQPRTAGPNLRSSGEQSRGAISQRDARNVPGSSSQQQQQHRPSPMQPFKNNIERHGTPSSRASASASLRLDFDSRKQDSRTAAAAAPIWGEDNSEEEEEETSGEGGEEDQAPEGFQRRGSEDLLDAAEEDFEGEEQEENADDPSIAFISSPWLPGFRRNNELDGSVSDRNLESSRLSNRQNRSVASQQQRQSLSARSNKQQRNINVASTINEHASNVNRAPSFSASSNFGRRISSASSHQQHQSNAAAAIGNRRSSLDPEQHYQQLQTHIDSIRGIFQQLIAEQQQFSMAQSESCSNASALGPFGGQPQLGAFVPGAPNAFWDLNASNNPWSSSAFLAQQTQLMVALLSCQQQLQMQQQEMRLLQQQYRDLALSTSGNDSQHSVRSSNNASSLQQAAAAPVQLPPLDGRPLSSASLYNLLAPNPYLTLPYFPPHLAPNAAANSQNPELPRSPRGGNRGTNEPSESSGTAHSTPQNRPGTAGNLNNGVANASGRNHGGSATENDAGPLLSIRNNNAQRWLSRSATHVPAANARNAASAILMNNNKENAGGGHVIASYRRDHQNATAPVSCSESENSSGQERNGSAQHFVSRHARSSTVPKLDLEMSYGKANNAAMAKNQKNLANRQLSASTAASESHQRRHSPSASNSAANLSRARTEGAVSSDNSGPENEEFERYREIIYSDVASLISQNESRPRFLCDLFRELLLLTASDGASAHTLDAIRGLSTHRRLNNHQRSASNSNNGFEVVSAADFVDPENEANIFEDSNITAEFLREILNTTTTTEDSELIEEDRRSQRRDLRQPNNATHTSSAVNQFSGSNSESLKHQGSSQSARNFMSNFHENDILLNPTSFSHRESSLPVSGKNKNAAGSRIKQPVGSNDNGSFGVQDWSSAAQNQDENEASTGAAAGESGGDVNMDDLEHQIQSIVEELIPFMRENVTQVCTPNLLAYLRKLVLTLATNKCHRSGVNDDFLQRQLSSILDDTLSRFNGQKLEDCGEELLADVSEIVFNELAFFRLMQNIGDGTVPISPGKMGRSGGRRLTASNSITTDTDDDSESAARFRQFLLEGSGGGGLTSDNNAAMSSSTGAEPDATEADASSYEPSSGLTSSSPGGSRSREVSLEPSVISGAATIFEAGSDVSEDASARTSVVSLLQISPQEAEPMDLSQSPVTAAGTPSKAIESSTTFPVKVPSFNIEETESDEEPQLPAILQDFVKERERSPNISSETGREVKVLLTTPLTVQLTAASSVSSDDERSLSSVSQSMHTAANQLSSGGGAAGGKEPSPAGTDSRETTPPSDDYDCAMDDQNGSAQGESEREDEASSVPEEQIELPVAGGSVPTDFVESTASQNGDNQPNVEESEITFFNLNYEPHPEDHVAVSMNFPANASQKDGRIESVSFDSSASSESEKLVAEKPEIFAANGENVPIVSGSDAIVANPLNSVVVENATDSLKPIEVKQ